MGDSHRRKKEAKGGVRKRGLGGGMMEKERRESAKRGIEQKEREQGSSRARSTGKCEPTRPFPTSSNFDIPQPYRNIGIRKVTE